MPGTAPPPILLRTFGYSRPILVALRSLSLKPISFGNKTPPIRFSQAGGQTAHKARPPNLELALTPLPNLYTGRRSFFRCMTPCRKTSRPPSHAPKLRSRRMQCRAARYAALLLLFCVISPIHATVQSSGEAGGAVATIAPAFPLRTRQRQKIIVGSAVNYTAELECSVRILRFFRYQKCDFLRVFLKRRVKNFSPQSFEMSSHTAV